YLDCHHAIEAGRVEGEPPRRAMHAVETRSHGMGEHRPGPVEPHDAGSAPAKRPGEPALTAAQVEHPAAVKRPQTFDDAHKPRVILLHAAVEPFVQGVEPGGDDRFMCCDHDVLPARVSSRCFHARTAAETPENRQKMKPAAPSRNPCFMTYSFKKVQAG